MRTDVWAETPVAAARKWFWTWPADQRAACERIRIGAYPAGGPKPWPYYEGPDVWYDPRQRFREIEE